MPDTTNLTVAKLLFTKRVRISLLLLYLFAGENGVKTGKIQTNKMTDMLMELYTQPKHIQLIQNISLLTALRRKNSNNEERNKQESGHKLLAAHYKQPSHILPRLCSAANYNMTTPALIRP